jgi:sulfoxide reductase heme-binding subunit YedZ
MSAAYKAVNWNRQKFIYDGVLAGAVVVTLALFVCLTLGLDAEATLETALIRGLGATAFLLFTVILLVGPLARLEPKALPILYNRRHLGVTMCLLALTHAAIALVQFHALGDVNPFVSLLDGAGDARRASTFPFEVLGLLALVVIVLMAATSHDYWLATLTAPTWKALHMLAYPAYALLVGHVALGSLQAADGILPGALLAGSALLVFGLHLLAGWRERKGDLAPAVTAGWVPVCRPEEIRGGRAKIGLVAGERVAVFRHGDRLSCVSNVCAHQNGPLGEGKVVDGCITCPWHGYQYLPDNGQSPPPFAEKIPTFNLALREGWVVVDPVPNPAGTRVEPVPVGAAAARSERADAFYVGYHPVAPRGIARGAGAMAAGAVTVALLGSALLARTQGAADPGTFEYGTLTTLRGQIREHPYPMLLVPGGPRTDRTAAYTRYLLVAEGKHGAQEAVAGRDGEWVDLTGTRIAREGRLMLEVAAHGVAHYEPPDNVRLGIPVPAPVTLGRYTLEGEIVDSKCWLGVMKPATGNVHRGCAHRCLAGGIPPLLMVDDGGGAPLHLLLTQADGSPAPRHFAERVGRRMELSGVVVREGELLVLRVEGMRER